MHRGLLIPTERPPTDIDIKRALLVLDEIQVPDPNDRELIPPEHFMAASSAAASGVALPFFASGGQPVLPLGKIKDYDVLFERVMSDCREAERQGALSVRAAPKFMPADQVALFGAPTPDGWPNSVFTYGVTKMLLSRFEWQTTALGGTLGPTLIRDQDLGSLAPSGRMFSNSTQITVGSQTGVDPPIQRFALEGVPQELWEVYSNLAAARLGSLVKNCGICEVGGLYPISMDSGINALLSKFQVKSATVFQEALDAENDPESLRLALRVERILFEQLVPDTVLGAMSVEQVLATRTKAWGEMGERRAKLFKLVKEIASEVADERAFEQRIKNEIESYNKTHVTLVDGLKKFGVAAAGFVVLDSPHAEPTKRLFEQLLGIGSWEVALLLGAGVALSQLGGSALDLWRALQERKDAAGRLLLAPYEGIH